MVIIVYLVTVLMERTTSALVTADNRVVEHAKLLEAQGIQRFDALHVACAVAGDADVFVTTDDRQLKKVQRIGLLPAMLPGAAIAFVEDWYEN